MVVSPITKKPAGLIESFHVSKIIERYKLDLGIDITEYFQGINELQLYRCLQTGYRFYYPNSIIGDSSFYNKLSEFTWYYSDWKKENEISLEFLNVKDQILDVGCGHGEYLIQLYKRGFKRLNGIDTSLTEAIINKNNFVALRSEGLRNIIKSEGLKYNAITAFQVLEHITDVDEFIRNCIALLQPGGKLIIAVPNSNPFLYKYDKYDPLNLPPHHQGLWDKNSLKELEKIYSISTLYIGVDRIGDEIGKYSHAFVEHFSNKNSFFKRVLRNRFVFKVVTKALHLMRRKIEGRNIIVVFSKD